MRFKLFFLAMLILSGFFFQSTVSAQILSAWRLDIKNSLNSANRGKSMAFDRSGGFYLLADSWVPDSSHDLLIIRVDTNGRELWKRVYDRGSHLDESPVALTVDTAGNAWICATTKTSYGDADILVLKYGLDGALLSEDQFGMISGTFDAPTSIVADRTGSVVMTGYATSLDSGLNFLVARYTPEGKMQWYRTYATVEMDIANDVAVDDSCNIYAVGTINAAPHTSDIFVARFDSAGVLSWEKRIDGIRSDNDGGLRIMADDSSRYIVTGFMNRAGDRSDIPIVLIDRNGETVKQQLFVGGTADCSVNVLDFENNVLTMAIRYYDYGLEKSGYYLVEYTGDLAQIYFLESTATESFFGLLKANDTRMALSAVVVPDEGTLRPAFYVPAQDTLPDYEWVDDSVNGLVYVRQVLVTDNAVYYFGDDASESTGTLSIMRYDLAPEFQKSPVSDKKKLDRKKPVVKSENVVRKKQIQKR